jgi:hypothetical protein
MILCDVTGWVLHACAYRHSKKNLRKEALRHFGKKNGDIGDAAREILKIMQRFGAEAAAAGKALSTKALYGADGLIPMLSTAVQGPAGRRQQQLACGDDLTSCTVCGVARPGPPRAAATSRTATTTRPVGSVETGGGPPRRPQ